MTADNGPPQPNETKPRNPPLPSPACVLEANRTLSEETAPSSIDDLTVERTESFCIGKSGDCERGGVDDEEDDDDDDDLDFPVETAAAAAAAAAPMTLPTSSSDAFMDPPASKYELWRDKCFDVLGGRVHFWVGACVMLLVIASGAVFFFMLIGAQTLCRPRKDCEPRNSVYNASIQVLNVLFTYLATISLPWRLANAVHLWPGSVRKSTKGLDLYGRPTEEIWFHIPQRWRRFMVPLLVGNSLTQYANQATRIVYSSYDQQDTPPGSVWTTVFFVSSMAMAMVAGFWQLHEEAKLRRQHPERFPPGPVAIAKRHWRHAATARRLRRRRRQQGADGAQAPPPDGQQQQLGPPLPDVEGNDEGGNNGLFNSLGKWFQSDQTSLNVWGL